MKMQFNFHKSIGLTPGFGPVVEKYRTGTVYGFRIGMSLVTLTVMK